MLVQLEPDLHWDPDSGHGVWFASEEHLHVHFGFRDEEWDLDVLKTVLILYGLFQEEIERCVNVLLKTSTRLSKQPP